MTTGKKEVIGTVTVEKPDGTSYLYAYIVKEAYIHIVEEN